MQVGYRTDPTTGKPFLAFWPLGMIEKNEKDIAKRETIKTGKIAGLDTDVHPNALVDYLLALGVAQVFTAERADLLTAAGITAKAYPDKDAFKKAQADFDVETGITTVLNSLYDGTYVIKTGEAKEAGDWFSRFVAAAKKALTDAGKADVAETFEETMRTRILSADQSASKDGIKLGRAAKGLVEERLMNPKKFRPFIEAWKSLGFPMPGESKVDIGDLEI